MAKTGIRSAAIITRDRKVLLMHRIKKRMEYWVLPGGGVEDEETYEEACIREVKEETGLDVLSLRLAFMNKTNVGGNDHPFYLCEVGDGEAILGGEESVKNSEKNFYELQWVGFEDLEKYFLLPENAKEKLIKMFQDIYL